MPFPSHAARPHVALFVETSINYGRGVLRGVARYQRESGPWSIFVEQRELGADLPRWIERWAGQGILTRSDDPRLLKARVPTVGLYDRIADELGLPMVLNDSRAVGRLAAQHLADRGFKSFAFLGMPGEYWSELRAAGVGEVVSAAQGTLAIFVERRRGKKRRDWETQQQELGEWIAALAKPLGLIACNDVHGLRALDACRRRGLAVPEEVAVIGADDDAELCELSDPPLSSIAFNPERVGYEASKLLARLMAGEAPPAEPQVIAPLGVVARQSTDILAIADRDVAQALHLIRRDACNGMTVESLLAALPISRRSLEQKFQRILGRTPKEEIQRVRIERAKLLLSETDQPIIVVGRHAGYGDPAYFSAAFKLATGKSPLAFRRAHASSGGE